MNRLFPILLLVFGSIQAQINLAVIEFEGKNVTREEASALTDRLRIELFRTGAFTVIERERMDAILKEQGFQLSDCSSDQCIVELGQLIGVQQIVAGSVMRVGNVYSIAARTISVEKGDLVRTAIFDHEGQIGDLLKFGMREVALQLAGLKSALSQAAPPVTQPTITPEQRDVPQQTTVTPSPRPIFNHHQIRKARIGVSFALNTTDIFGKDTKWFRVYPLESKPKAGTEFGIFSLFQLSRYIYLRPECMFTRKGFEKKYTSADDSKYTWTINLDYLAVPFLVQLNLPLSSSTDFYFITGAAGNFLTNASEIKQIEGEDSDKENIKNLIRAGESSLILGFGTEIKGRFLLEFRADLGLTSIDGELDDPDEAYDVKNSVVGISLGICF